MKFTIIIIFLVILAGCAMITRGPLQEIEFTSNTDSVTVYVNNKDIGQTPATVELWKIRKNHATFYLPDGQEQHYLLKTHINSAILNNGLLLLVDPFLGIGAFACDYLICSGRSFNEETLRFKDAEKNKVITVNIASKIRKPEKYFLISGGLGVYSYFDDYKDNFICIPDFSFEIIQSYRGRYHLGLGVGFEYINKLEDRKDIVNVPIYFLVKFSPFNRDAALRLYLTTQGGMGWSWGYVKGDYMTAPILIYGAGGLGVEYKKKVYLEMLSKVKLFHIILGEGHGLGNETFVLRIGYRFNL